MQVAYGSLGTLSTNPSRQLRKRHSFGIRELSVAFSNQATECCDSLKAHRVLLQIPQRGYPPLMNCIYDFRVLLIKLQYFDSHRIPSMLPKGDW